MIWFPKAKLIVHEHGRVFQNSIIYKYFLKLSRKSVDLFLVVSKTTKDCLLKNAGIERNRIEILYNFVDLKRFSRKNITWNILEEKRKLNIKEGDYVIGFVGRLSSVKGCEYLLKSLPHLKFDYHCLIVGDGDLRGSLEGLGKSLDIENNVKFLGYREDTLKTYSLLDVLVVPSLSESFGISVLEAQALRIPVIATNLQSLSEIIVDKERGLLFEAKNSVELAEKINLIAHDHQLSEKLIQGGLKSVLNYGLEEYLKKLSSHYENVK